MSYNPWLYSYANPTNLTDPSGYDSQLCQDFSKITEGAYVGNLPAPIRFGVDFAIGSVVEPLAGAGCMVDSLHDHPQQTFNAVSQSFIQIGAPDAVDRFVESRYLSAWGKHPGLVLGRLGLDATAAYGMAETASSLSRLPSLGLGGSPNPRLVIANIEAQAIPGEPCPLEALYAVGGGEASLDGEVGIIVRPRGTLGEGDAGHFVVYTKIGDDIQVRGFWPQKEGLPSDPKELFDVLFNSNRPGEVRNDAKMLKQTGISGVVQASRPATLEEVQQLRALLGEEGPRDNFYSFNPDNFENTYNCVTWGCNQFNQVFDPDIGPIRQGRVKIVVDVIKNLPAPWQVVVGK
jgi:hypothetical protein